MAAVPPSATSSVPAAQAAGVAGAGEEQAARAVEHALHQVAFWRAMQQSILADSKTLRWLLPAGAGAALLVALISRRFDAAGGVLALMLGTYAVGLYFVRVRQNEYAYNVHEAEAALTEAQQALRAAAGKTAPPPATATAPARP